MSRARGIPPFYAEVRTMVGVLIVCFVLLLLGSVLLILACIRETEENLGSVTDRGKRC